MEDGTIFAGVAIGVAAAVAAFVQSRWRRPTARTGPFSAPAWAAAEALAKSRGHAELGEEHLFAALLFDTSIARKLTDESLNVDAMHVWLDEHLGAVATYRTNESTSVALAPSLSKRVRGVRDDVDALFAVLRAEPTPAIAEALAIGRSTPPEPPESGRIEPVHLSVANTQSRTALVPILERHFGLSRAAATFIAETAIRDRQALIGFLPVQTATVMIAAANTELPPGASVWIPDDETTAKASAKTDVKIDKSVELALTLAATNAKEEGHAEVTSSHLLRALVRQKHIAAALTAAGANLPAIEEVIDDDLSAVPKQTKPDLPPATDGLQRVIRHAVTTAVGARMTVDEACVLHSLFKEGDMGTLRALGAAGIERSAILGAVYERRKRPPRKDGEKEIVLYDDDVTTMAQVISLLTAIFGFDDATAHELMFEVHFLGESVIGCYPASDAEVHVKRARAWCEQQQIPVRLAAR